MNEFSYFAYKKPPLYGVVFIKSESYLFCFNDHLFLCLPYFVFPIDSPPFLSPFNPTFAPNVLSR